MPKLELTIKCLCLLVPDVAARTVYVLMPSTSGHTGHGGHGSHGAHAINPHVVRILHRTKLPTKGISMEDWELQLGGGVGTADTSLQPAKSAFWGEQIADLTPCVDGQPIKRRLLSGRAEEVSARITLRSGRLTSLHSEAEWALCGKRIAMANRVTWTIDDVADELSWIDLGTEADRQVPLPSLAGLSTQGGKVVRISITHETEASIQQGASTLPESGVRDHFRAFYRLYGINDPREDQLPSAVWRWNNSEMSGGSKKQMENLPWRHKPRDDVRYGCPTAKGSLG